jgi:hypothetical protein
VYNLWMPLLMLMLVALLSVNLPSTVQRDATLRKDIEASSRHMKNVTGSGDDFARSRNSYHDNRGPVRERR